MFARIAIIGLGLIGGSLARAVKARFPETQIAGCARTQETLDIADELQFIDAAFTDAAEAVKEADLVVLCTPLSTYAPITQSIAPHLKPGAIITDVGSVKRGIIKDVTSNLSPEQVALFVPGHPIAGAEQSGPEAGSADLFEGQKVILTPPKKTDAAATGQVTALWEALGARVIELQPRKHDHLYAMVSHNVQFLSYAYGLTVKSLSAEIYDEISQHVDKNYRKFIRLNGSDPVMWRDIFIINWEEMEPGIQAFIDNLYSLTKAVENRDEVTLKRRLEHARKKRLEFHYIYKGHHHTTFFESRYASLRPYTLTFMEIMPELIGCAVMEKVRKVDYEYAAGAGFHGLTKNVVLPTALDTNRILEYRKPIIAAMSNYITHVDKMRIVVSRKDTAQLEQLLRSAQDAYYDITSYAA